MSFGFSISDIVGLIRITVKTIEGSKKACGEYDELTREVTGLHDVLESLRSDLSDPTSLLHHANKGRRLELQSHISGCEKQLLMMDAVLEKFNTLGNEDRTNATLWQKVRFGNGHVSDLGQIRLKLSTYTTAIGMSLQLLSLGSQGRVERQLGRQSGELRGIREAINFVLAKLNAVARDESRPEGSITTSMYSNDDPAFWKCLRRDLNKKRFPSKLLKPHKNLILDYVKELSERGVLDEKRGRSEGSLLSSGSREVSIDRSRLDGTTAHLSHWRHQISTDILGMGGPRLWQATVEDESMEQLRYIYNDVANSASTEDKTPVVAHSHHDDSPTVNLETEKLQESDLEEALPASISEEMAEMARRIQYLETVNRQQQEQLEAATLLSIESKREAIESELIFARRLEEARVYREVALADDPENEPDRRIEDGERNPETRSVLDYEAVQGEESAQDLVRHNEANAQQPEVDENTPNGNEGTLIPVLDNHLVTATIKELVPYVKPIDLFAEWALLPVKEREKTISFQDNLGRKFGWPYHLVRTWEGFFELIMASSCYMHIFHRNVRHGYFDIVSADGAIILPLTWESLVQPGQSFTMRMWLLPPPPPVPRSFNYQSRTNLKQRSRRQLLLY